MRQVIALSLVLAASPAIAAHCPHGQLWRVRMDKCVSLSSPAALAYARPLPRRQRIKIVLPADPEPPIAPIEVHMQDVDPDITDIPLTDPDPATMALKLQLEKQ
jgi:hypothetical protein